MNLEAFAICRYAKRGKCGDADYHRAALVPIKSLLDGGLPGDVCAAFCLVCEKRLAESAFLPIKQPNAIGR